MKLYKENTIQVPAVEAHEEIKRKLVGVECDICHEPYDDTDILGHGIDTSYTNVSFTEGYHCSDGADETSIYFDICPNCFKTKLIPFLGSLGAQPRTERREW